MRTIKAKYPDGSPLNVTFPTSTREVKVIFLMYGIHAWLVKIGGVYDILYPNTKENGGPQWHNTGLRTVDALSMKGWLELAQKHCPEVNKCEPYCDKSTSFFKWPNVKRLIEQETT